MFRFAAISTIMFFLLSCGSIDDCEDKTSPNYDAEKCEVATVDEEVPYDFVLQGSVVSAFEVTVNGERFDDMEQYFTTEVARLPDKVVEAGYDGYDTRFDAEIGFRDLSVGMDVYVSSAEDRGFAGQTTVSNNNTFKISLPAEAAGDTYRVRANKKTSVYLSKHGILEKQICYNFSAVDLSVSYEEKDNPVILDNFESSVTAYDCTRSSGSDIPENDFRSVLIAPGVSADDVYVMNDEYTAMRYVHEDSSARWMLWEYSSDFCESDADIDGEYDCSILLDDSGHVVFQENVRFEYLDPEVVWPTKDEAIASVQP